MIVLEVNPSAQFSPKQNYGHRNGENFTNFLAKVANFDPLSALYLRIGKIYILKVTFETILST